MIYLWTFLVLAFVHSGSCSSSYSSFSSLEPAIYDTFQDYSYLLSSDTEYPTIQVAPLLPPVTGIGLGKPLLVKVTITGENDYLLLEVSLTADLLCSLGIANIKIAVSAHLSITTNTGCGCVHYDLLEGTLGCTLSANGQTFVSLDVVLVAITPAVRNTMKTVIYLLNAKLNFLSELQAVPFYIGNTEYSYEVTDVQTGTTGIVSSIGLYVGGASVLLGDITGDLTTLPATVLHACKFSDSVLALVMKPVLAGASLEVELSAAVIPWSSNYPGSSWSLYVEYKEMYSCGFTSAGASLSVKLTVKLRAGATVVADLEVDVTLTGTVTVNHGHLGLTVTAHVTANLAVTFTHGECGCTDTMEVWISAQLDLNLGLFIGLINCHTEKLLPVPIPTGPPGTTTTATPSEGGCLITSYE